MEEPTKETTELVNATPTPQIGADNESLLPGQKSGLDPKGADKFNIHPQSVVWDDPAMRKAWEALDAEE